MTPSTPAEGRGRSRPREVWRWHRVPISVALVSSTRGEEDVEDTEQHVQSMVEETLVEEVSIDGMCGVY